MRVSAPVVERQGAGGRGSDSCLPAEAGARAGLAAVRVRTAADRGRRRWRRGAGGRRGVVPGGARRGVLPALPEAPRSRSGPAWWRIPGQAGNKGDLCPCMDILVVPKPAVRKPMDVRWTTDGVLGGLFGGPISIGQAGGP